jgi:glycosyltransferase involved in cell wall biosynthesis
MKVLHLGKFWPPRYGGIESVNWGIHDFLNSHGIECKSLVFDNSSIKEKNVIKAKFILLFGKFPLSLSYLTHLHTEIRKADIVHVHFPNPLVVLFFLTKFRKSSLPVLIIHWHSDLVKFPLLDRFYDFVIRNLVLSKSQCIIVTSAVYRETSRALKFIDTRVEVIPNFLLTMNVTIRDSIKSVCSNNSVKLLAVGRNTLYKGYHFLIDCFNLLPANYTLTIVGRDLDSIFLPTHLQSRIFLKEGIEEEELKSVYENSDIFILGSNTRAEAFGVVLIEAMSFGLPTVSFRIPGSGVLEVVKDNVTGILVENEDVKSMAAAVQRLSEDSELYYTMSLNAQKRASFFSSLNICPRFLDLYRDLLSENGDK